jgi:hypothetical protein
MIATVWQGITRPVAVQTITDWDALKQQLHQHRATLSKSTGRLWSPVVLKAGTYTRANANIEAVTALVLDFDAGERWRDVRQQLDGEWVAYTTFSHSGWGERFHVVKRLAQPVAAAEWPDVYRKAAARYGKADNLPAPSHSYYLPQHQPGMQHWTEVSA